MKTAVIYARYSSDNQTEQSIEGQLRVCQQFAQNNDILVLDTYIDRAMTGTNDARPDFQRMLKDCSKRAWDIILVYKIDRFSRNKYEIAMHKKTLRDNGIKLVSAMENIPDTPEGIILESLLEGMAEYYSAELSQKVHRGLKESYLKGYFTGGGKVFGYDIIDKKPVINQFESKIVQEIFEKFSQGYTGVSIVNDLKKRGIRNKTGNYFSTSNIYHMISNATYTGKRTHSGVVYTNIYPRIIDDLVWNKVQDIRMANKHAPGRKKDILDFILSGKIVCGYCKANIVGESGTSKCGNRHYYYNCLSKRKRRHPCEFKAIKKQELEDLVINTTWNLLYDKEIINNIANLILKKHEQTSKQDTVLKSLQAKLNTSQKASENLISAIEQGIITEQTKIRLKELEQEISQLKFEIEQEKLRNYTYLTKNQIIDYLENVIKGNIENISIRKKIVTTFIREIIVYHDKIVITYNFYNEPTLDKTSRKETIQNIEKVISENTSDFYNIECSYNQLSTQPSENQLNTDIKPFFNGSFYFCSKNTLKNV